MNEKKIIEVNALIRSKSRTELVAMCKEKNLNASGTKHDMAVRLIGGWDTDKESVATPSFSKILVEKNDAGKFVYDGLLFDEKTKNVVGVWSDGSVRPLSRQDIENCKKYKFRYVLPETLDENPDRAPVVIESSSEDDGSDGDDDDGNESLTF